MLYQRKNPHGGDSYVGGICLDFSASINPLGTPKGVLEAMRQSLGEVCRYPDPCCRRLVEAIADAEHVPEGDILCGCGAAELIYAYCGVLRPRIALVMAPTFSEYAQALELVGCRVEQYPLARENDFDLDSGFLSYLEENRPEVLFLCTPNNPTGRLIPRELLLEILAICGRRDIRILLDECFLELSEGGVSAKDLLGQYPQMVILQAFTKSFGLAGVRLGYCLSRDRALLEKMSCQVQPWNVSIVAQAAGVAAAREQQFLLDARALISTERRWLTAALENCGIWVCPSAANYLLLHGEPGLDIALRRHGIAIRNCNNYQGLGDGWYRVAVRSHEENVKLMQAIRYVYGKGQVWQKT